MIYWRFFVARLIFLLVSCVCISWQQSCNVLSQCQNDALSWKPWPYEVERGYPGPRGPMGPKGEKGAKGEPANQDIANPGPTREFLSHAMTWKSAEVHCKAKGRRLCRGNEICIHEGNGRRMIHEVIEGDHWTPVLDGENKWVQAGDSRRFTCYTHTETHGGAMAGWGTLFQPYPHKGYVYCCGWKYEGIRYRYIGKTATYDSSKQHCVNLGRRLCHASEVCDENVPVYGTIAREAWVAVNDRHNEWVQIGDSRTCFVHGIHYNPPSWGVRTDGSALDAVGFVLCC